MRKKCEIFFGILKINPELDPDPDPIVRGTVRYGSAPKCHGSATLVRILAFRDKFPACLLHVGRQDDQELHQEFILAAKGQSPFILD
jgi:hypothetical protein